jgi:hypothetical protein
VLYQLSYAPGLRHDCIGAPVSSLNRVPAPLGVLFLFLAACFAGVAYAAGGAHKWVIAVAAAAIAAWFANSAFRLLRRHR